MQNIKLIGLEGNKISIVSNHEDRKALLAREHEYITKKALDFFGKKLTFHLTEQGFVEVNPDESSTAPNESEPAARESKSSQDPMENFIIDEMGGEELK